MTIGQDKYKHAIGCFLIAVVAALAAKYWEAMIPPVIAGVIVAAGVGISKEVLDIRRKLKAGWPREAVIKDSIQDLIADGVGIVLSLPVMLWWTL